MLLHWLEVLLIVAVVLVAVLAVRRTLLNRTGGTVELSMRFAQRPRARGWMLGVGRYVGDQLLFYRIFSFALRPHRSLSRRSLRVRTRRAPRGPEALSLQSGAVVLECTTGEDPVQLAMNESALPGFLSWLESGPPGSTYRPLSGTGSD